MHPDWTSQIFAFCLLYCRAGVQNVVTVSDIRVHKLYKVPDIATLVDDASADADNKYSPDNSAISNRIDNDAQKHKRQVHNTKIHGDHSKNKWILVLEYNDDVRLRDPILHYNHLHSIQLSHNAHPDVPGQIVYSIRLRVVAE